MADSSSRVPPKQVDDLISAVSKASFIDWHHDQQYAQNIRNGKHYFNHPSPPQPASRHSPSKLLTCHRKTYYSQQNAPEERRAPEGVFWFGSKFEQELAVPFLRSLVGPDQYVQNSLWVDFEVPSEEGTLHFRGETDPVIVDDEASPLLLTEIKTTTSLDSLEEPRRRHRAQAHAYMEGLSRDTEGPVRDALIIYGDRDEFQLKVFHVPFDTAFWNDIVLGWAEKNSDYRERGVLPAAKPAVSWECEYCPYRGRCGQTSAPHEDAPTQGLLPLTEYPRWQLETYLEAFPDAVLTPTTAHQHPEVAARASVAAWVCEACGSEYEWETVEWAGDTDEPPLCPVCCEANVPAPLSGPAPESQKKAMGSEA